MILKSECNRRAGLDCRMHAAEVVEHEEQGHRAPVVLDLLAVSVREPSKPPRLHPNRQVVALDEACRDVFVVR